jgi:hypothetical protein
MQRPISLSIVGNSWGATLLVGSAPVLFPRLIFVTQAGSGKCKEVSGFQQSAVTAGVPILLAIDMYLFRIGLFSQGWRF